MRCILPGVLLAMTMLSGCAVIKTTDVTDASFKRHQSVALLGWPIYTRITDKEPGLSTPVVHKLDENQYGSQLRAAEMLSGSIEPDWATPEEP